MSDDINDAQSMGMYHFQYPRPAGDELRKLGVAGTYHFAPHGGDPVDLSDVIESTVLDYEQPLHVVVDPTMEPGTMRIVPHPQDVRDWQFPDTYDHDFIWHAEYGDSGWVDENDWVGVQERALNELLREAGVQ